MHSSSSIKSSFSKRIVNGKSTDISEFPFIGSISIDYGLNEQICTGSLISSNIIITAASCLYDFRIHKIFDYSKISLKFGSNTIINKEDNVYKPKIIAFHPDYDSSNEYNNIALILLDNPVSSDIAMSAQLYTGKVAESLKVRTAGWGVTTTDNPIIEDLEYSSTLNSIEIIIDTLKNCERAPAKFFGSSGGSICSVNKNNQGICLGDIGNPLTALDGGSNKLVGIASRVTIQADTLKELITGSLSCGKSGIGAIFLHLNYYIDWINETIEKLGGNSISFNQDSNSTDSSKNSDNSTDFSKNSNSSTDSSKNSDTMSSKT
ncbi:hypothetical protein BB561_005434 [Smittium simulii]|uniref:Peptidase S1 domain-containing protein n=1 Tax=Smittium simulii TaxID=133385 RepID=A0A2T9YAD8_9FUNG|nr:hypothetical protein BB561_005434 [Smittium simulii]